MRTLDVFVTSRVKLKVLRYYMQGGEPVYCRELGRRVNEDAGNISRVLKELTKTGFMRVEYGVYIVNQPEKLSLLQQFDATDEPFVL